MAETNYQGDARATDLKAKAADLGQQIKDQAQDALQSTAQVASDKLREASEAAKDVASSAADKLQENAASRQASGADYLERFAGHMREASQIFTHDAPLAEKGIASAASYVEDAAGRLRNGSPRDLVGLATDFARRNPAAFLGVSALAGFAIMRFLKASDTPSHREG